MFFLRFLFFWLIAAVVGRTTMFEATDLDNPLLDDEGKSIDEHRIVMRSILPNFSDVS
jgi:hypothetical protein